MKYVLCIFLVLFLSNVAVANEFSCSKALALTKKVCTGSKIIHQLSMLFKSLQIYKSAKSIGQACNVASQISQISALGNAAYSVSCGNSARSCKRNCENNREISECENYGEVANLAKLQSVAHALNMTKSKTCAEAVKHSARDTLKEPNNTAPIQYQFDREKDSWNGFAPTNSVLELNYDNSSIFPEIEPKNSDSFTDVQEIEAEGREFAGSSEKSFAINNETNQPKTEETRKEILLPSGFSGVESGGNNSWVSRGGTVAVEEGDSHFDLKDFLPKGAKDPARNIAGAGYPDKTITPANGLSNFQKVTRKLNEKRSELLP